MCAMWLLGSPIAARPRRAVAARHRQSPNPAAERHRALSYAVHPRPSYTHARGADPSCGEAGALVHRPLAASEARGRGLAAAVETRRALRIDRRELGLTSNDPRRYCNPRIPAGGFVASSRLHPCTLCARKPLFHVVDSALYVVDRDDRTSRPRRDGAHGGAADSRQQYARSGSNPNLPKLILFMC